MKTTVNNLTEDNQNCKHLDIYDLLSNREQNPPDMTISLSGYHAKRISIRHTYGHLIWLAAKVVLEFSTFINWWLTVLCPILLESERARGTRKRRSGTRSPITQPLWLKYSSKLQKHDQNTIWCWALACWPAHSFVDETKQQKFLISMWLDQPVAVNIESTTLCVCVCVWDRAAIDSSLIDVESKERRRRRRKTTGTKQIYNWMETSISNNFVRLNIMNIKCHQLSVKWAAITSPTQYLGYNHRPVKCI